MNRLCNPSLRRCRNRCLLLRRYSIGNGAKLSSPRVTGAQLALFIITLSTSRIFDAQAAPSDPFTSRYNVLREARNDLEETFLDKRINKQTRKEYNTELSLNESHAKIYQRIFIKMLRKFFSLPILSLSDSLYKYINNVKKFQT